MDITHGFFEPTDLIVTLVKTFTLVGGIVFGVVVVVIAVIFVAINIVRLALRAFGVHTATATQVFVLTICGLAPALGLYGWMHVSQAESDLIIPVLLMALLAGAAMDVFILAALTHSPNENPAEAEVDTNS